jgi:hypothetical protein
MEPRRFRSAQFLEEGRLGLDEELVDRGDRQIIDQAEIDAHAHA